MRKILFVILFSAGSFLGLAQRPDSPTGSGISREERGPDQQAVLRQGSGSEEAPAIQRRIEEEGSLPPDLSSPKSRGAAGTPAPGNPATEPSSEPRKFPFVWTFFGSIIAISLVL